MLLAIGWKGKKEKDSNRSFGRLLGIGGGNDGCEGKKEKREGQIFPMLLAIGCKEKKRKRYESIIIDPLGGG